MDHTFLYSIAAGIAIVLLIVIARVAVRWIVRIVLVGLILLIAAGGLAWWWFKESPRQSEPQSRTTTRRTTDNRR